MWLMHRITLYCWLLLLVTACAQAAGPTTPVTLPTEFAATPDRASTEPAATAVVNSADTPAPSATKDNPAASGAVVVLQRSGGLEGTTDEWAIFADGSGQHASDGQAPVTTAGVMSPDEVERLVADIQALGFFAMADDYGRDVQCADCFHYGLTVNAGGQTKTVRAVDGAPDAPPELWEAIDRVQEVVAGLPPP